MYLFIVIPIPIPIPNPLPKGPSWSITVPLVNLTGLKVFESCIEAPFLVLIASGPSYSPQIYCI